MPTHVLSLTQQGFPLALAHLPMRVSKLMGEWKIIAHLPGLASGIFAHAQMTPRSPRKKEENRRKFHHNRKKSRFLRTWLAEDC